MAKANPPKARQPKPNAPDKGALVLGVCERMADGELVEHAAKATGVTAKTIRQWCVEDEELGALYARAREAQAHALAERAIMAAHGTDDFADAVQRVINATEVALVAAGNPNWRTLVNALQNGAVQRDKLRVDALKWYTAKVAPKLYGDKQTHAHEGGVTVRVEYADDDE